MGKTVIDKVRQSPPTSPPRKDRAEKQTRKEKAKAKAKLNSSTSNANTMTMQITETQSKTETETVTSAASPSRNRANSSSLSRPQIYTDIDQDHVRNDATSLLWEPGSNGNDANHAGDDIAPAKESVAAAQKKMPPPAAATRYMLTHRVGDSPPVIVKGVKYVYDRRLTRWMTHPVSIRVLHYNRGVAQDDYYATFAVELLDPVKPAAPMFAKMYRHNIADVAEADYFSLGQAQTLCEEFARDYTSSESRPGYVKFHLPLLTNRVVVRLHMESIYDAEIRKSRKGFFSYRTQDTREMMFFMEPNSLACASVGASFASPEVDNGHVYPPGDPSWVREIYHDIADGLSHFTYVKSRERMVVHGFYRSNGYLLDPLFHTTEREGFRMGDGGKAAIQAWAHTHRCGDTCRALGISIFDAQGRQLPKKPVFINPLDAQDNYYTDFLRSIRQMRHVVRIGGSGEELDASSDAIYDAVSDSSGVTSTAVTLLPAPVEPPSTKVTVDATKYVFMPSNAKWTEVPMRLTVCAPSSPELVQGKYACFAVEEVLDGGRGVPMRARFIIRENTFDADYYHIGDAYCVCVALGQVFRSYRKKCVFERELDFYSAYAVRVARENIPDSVKAHMRDSNFFARTSADSGDIMFVVEPEFHSDAQQRPAAAGGMKRDAYGFNDLVLRQVVDAFSHFTLHKSGNHMLVCNFQCKNGLLMHPQVNTSNGCGFETINRGQAGIDAWVRSHKCNELCGVLGMEPLPPRLKLYNISSSQLMKYINYVQQHTMAVNERLAFAAPHRCTDPAFSAAASVNRTREEPTKAPSAAPAAPRPAPMKPAGDLMLRPWAAGRKGVPPRRALTQTEQSRLAAKKIDTTYLFPATRYDLDIDTLSWTAQRTFVRISNPDRGIGQGGMRVCFEVADVDPDVGEESVMVAKMYRRTIKDVVEKDYFTSVTVQKLSALFAADFNKEKREGNAVRVNVLDGAVIAIDRADLSPELLAKRTGFFSYRTSDSQRLMFTVEAKLVGRFTKYNGNMGEAYPTNESRQTPAAARERTLVFEAVEALSHYSLQKSEGGLLLCDMQGVGNDLTDLEVHTYDGQGLGVGNFGARGIQKFAQRHRCTSVCKALNLELLTEQRVDVTDAVKKNNRFVAIFERSKEIDKAK